LTKVFNVTSFSFLIWNLLFPYLDVLTNSQDAVVALARQLQASNVALYHFAGHAVEQWIMACNWFTHQDENMNMDARMEIAKPQLNNNSQSEYMLQYDFARDFLFLRLKFPLLATKKMFRMEKIYRSFYLKDASSVSLYYFPSSFISC